MTGLKLSRIGVVFYVLWGVLHIIIAAAVLYIYLILGTPGMLSFFGLNDPEQLPVEASKIAGSLGVLLAANIAILGIITIIIAIAGIWKKSAIAFWMNLIITGLAEAAFILVFFIPGYIRGIEWIIGSLLFVLGALFSGVGLLVRDHKNKIIPEL